MDKAHGIRAIPRPSKPDDPAAEVVRGIEATTRQALRRFTAALILAVALVLVVLVGIGVPLPLVAVVLGLAVLVVVAPSPRRFR